MKMIEVIRRTELFTNIHTLRLITKIETNLMEICLQTKQNASSLKEVLKESFEQLDVMQKVKSDRLNQFLEIIDQIRRILIEIGQTKFNPSLISLNEFDLSVRKLEELQRQLHLLESEKVRV